MPGVNIEYKGETLASIPNTGSKTLKTQGKYCEGDIIVNYIAPSSSTPVMQSKTVTPTTSQQTVQPDNGYDGLSSVTINATPLESKTITPSSSQQIVTPTSPNIGLSSVTVEAAPAPTPITAKALNLYDWEGTLLQSYTYAEAQALTALPSSPGVEHDLLTFQTWNWSLSDIKSWLTSNPHGRLNVGAIYTTSDSQDHNYWNNSRLNGSTTISMHKKASTSSVSFADCNALERINIPNGITVINASAFSGCFSLKHINLPSSVTNIGTGGFQNCYSLEEICLPKSLTAIGATNFQSCSALKELIIPDAVTTIGNYSINNCKSLTNIVINSGVTSIGTKAFADCSALNDIVIKGKPSLSNANAFDNGPSTRRYYAYRNDLSFFETTSNWPSLYSQFVAIEDYISYLNGIGIDV